LLLFCDSFDHYNTAQIPVKWPLFGGGGASIQGLVARTGQAIRFTNSFCGVGKFLPLSNRVILGFAFALPFPAAGAMCCFWDDIGGATQVTLTPLSSGLLQVRSGGASGTVLGTTAGPLPTVGFHYLEVAVTFGNPGGSVEVRVDTVPVLVLSGVNTAPSGFPFVTIFGINRDSGPAPTAGLPVVWFVDDLYIVDDQGGINDDFLNAPSVQCLNPSGEGALSGWQPVGLTPNYRCVDGSTDPLVVPHLLASDIGQADLYPVPAPAGEPVYAVQTCIMRTGLLDVLTTGVQELIRSGGTDFPGPTWIGSNTYYGCTPHDVDPFTNAPWTADGVGAAQFGQALAPF
jgi:hypothetical protein